jgi:putative ABC transport system permease protein
MAVLETMNTMLEKASFVFRFMAAFIVGTGLVVLAAVMASGRFQRLQESVLLRTMGASRATIARIQLVEYWMLGTLAAGAGVLLAWVAAWALGRWIFDLAARPAVLPMLWAWLILGALTVVTGWLSGRRLLNHPPLEVLRQET